LIARATPIYLWADHVGSDRQESVNVVVGAATEAGQGGMRACGSRENFCDAVSAVTPPGTSKVGV